MVSLIPFNRRGNYAMSPGSDNFFNMLDDFFSRDFSPARNLAGDTFKIDVEDAGNEYKVYAELPGVGREEVKLDFEDGRLSIGVERNESTNEEGKQYIHKETRRTSMCRNIYLADSEPDGIKAKLEDGLLSVTVSKKQKAAAARKIEIQ